MEEAVKVRKEVSNLSTKLEVRKKKKLFDKSTFKMSGNQCRGGSETGEWTGTDRQTEKEESSEKTTSTTKYGISLFNF